MAEQEAIWDVVPRWKSVSEVEQLPPERMFKHRFSPSSKTAENQKKPASAVESRVYGEVRVSEFYSAPSL
jgi:hypothetical protein